MSEPWEEAAEFYMSAPDTAAERDELQRQLGALRKRNAKLERVAEAARWWWQTDFTIQSELELMSQTEIARVAATAAKAKKALDDALSDLDKEDA